MIVVKQRRNSAASLFTNIQSTVDSAHLHQNYPGANNGKVLADMKRLDIEFSVNNLTSAEKLPPPYVKMWETAGLTVPLVFQCQSVATV